MSSATNDTAMVALHDQMNAALLMYENAQGIKKRDGDEATVIPWVLKMHSILEEAATLGSGECHNESEYPQMFFLCSECGYKNWDTYEGSDSFNFCPSCGRKVISKEEPRNDIHAVVNVPDWPIQTINVTFQGMNLTLDADESERFMRAIRDHVRRAEESGVSDD